MTHIYVDLTPEEVAKFHALGGSAWVRVQVQAAPEPTGMRGLFGLSPDERAALVADLPLLGRKATARKYRIKPSAIDVLRRRTPVAVDLRKCRPSRNPLAGLRKAGAT
jgi:hypothetical protein